MPESPPAFREAGMLRLSRWVHCFERERILAFFHSLSFNIVFVPLDLGVKLRQKLIRPAPRAELVSLADEDTISILTEQGVLVHTGQDDFATFVSLRSDLLKDVTLELLYLLITDSCNMRCTYCFEESPVSPLPFHEAQMSAEVVTGAVVFFAGMTRRYGDPNKEKTIQFYGGEPLLNKAAITAVTAHIRDLKRSSVLPSSCRVATVTNGLLVDEEAAQFFAENEITVGLSLDGPERLNNLYRLPKDRNINAFERTTRALSLLQSSGAAIGLSITLTPAAIEHFDELLDFCLDHVGRINGISLNILNFTRNITPPPDYYERAARCQLLAFERFRARGIYEERVMRKVRAFVTQQPMFGDCGVQGNQLVISADGKIGVCQDFMKPRTYFRGNVLDDDVDPIAEGLFDGWKNRSPFFMEQCFDCAAISICGGGCPASAELKTGNRWNIDERACQHSKLTLEWLI